MKIDNDEVWQDVKNGKYLGFSIEGFFSDNLKDEEETEADKLYKEIEAIINKYENG